MFGTNPGNVAEVAEKFIARMDERNLADEIGLHQAAMPAQGRCALVESIFDAFRHRGESSEDVAEAVGAPLDAMQRGDVPAVALLLAYVQQNTGILKEAATALIENDPSMLSHLPGTIVQGISAKLATS
ncbi:MAG: hypothetical protein M3126_06385 [Candidatus Eremiobacteraeota bacterium]|nr:hypothetical protein [Candidatus Eremiobacteraeota bacterium]